MRPGAQLWSIWDGPLGDLGVQIVRIWDGPLGDLGVQLSGIWDGPLGDLEVQMWSIWGGPLRDLGVQLSSKYMGRPAGRPGNVVVGYGMAGQETWEFNRRFCICSFAQVFISKASIFNLQFVSVLLVCSVDLQVIL